MSARATPLGTWYPSGEGVDNMRRSLIQLFLFSLVLSGCGDKIKPDVLPAKGVALVRMTQWQEPWFAERLKKWPGCKKVAVQTTSYQTLQELPDLLKQSLKEPRKEPYLIVKIEGRMLPTLIEHKLLYPLEKLVPDGETPKWRKELDGRGVAPAFKDGYTWALPRKIENHIFGYRTFFVRQAALYWTSMRDEIDEIFKNENGKGLPKGYTLESDPEMWDVFDLAVAGYYWSKTRIKGSVGPRLGHRTKDYPGTYVDIAARLFSLGGTPDELIKVRGQALVDFLTWEAFFMRYGLYHRSMVDPGWFGGDTYRTFSDYSLLALTLHQVDAIQFHRQFGPKDEDDEQSAIDFAQMYRGVSFELNEKGQPKRVGNRRTHLAGWWWGIPSSCPCPRLALEMLNYILSREFQQEECAKFGNYPVRMDLLEDVTSAFPEKWMQKVFKVSERQFEEDCFPIPDERLTYRKQATVLFDLWRRVMSHPKLYDKSVPLSALGIKKMVEQPN